MFLIDITVTHGMPNIGAVLLVKLPFVKGLACMQKTAHFILWTPFHERANGHCENQVSGFASLIW